MRKLVFLLFAIGICACTQYQNKVPNITTGDAVIEGQQLNENVVVYPNIRYAGTNAGLSSPTIDVYRPIETSKKSYPVLLYFKGQEYAVEENPLILPIDSLVGHGIVVVRAALEIDSDFQYELSVFKWVYENINAFGGDSNKLAIAGPTDGIASVSQMMASPVFSDKIAGVIGIAGETNLYRNESSSTIDSLFSVGKQAQVPLLIHLSNAQMTAGKWYELHSKTCAQPVFLFQGGLASEKAVSIFSRMCVNFLRSGNPNIQISSEWVPINGQTVPTVYSFDNIN